MCLPYPTPVLQAESACLVTPLGKKGEFYPFFQKLLHNDSCSLQELGINVGARRLILGKYLAHLRAAGDRDNNPGYAQSPMALQASIPDARPPLSPAPKDCSADVLAESLWLMALHN